MVEICCSILGWEERKVVASREQDSKRAFCKTAYHNYLKTAYHEISELVHDRIVAERQKHNGMSWSFKGSEALAILTTVRLNNTLDSWLHEGKLTMSLEAEGRILSSIRAA